MFIPLLDRETIAPLPLKERLALAKERGDDFILALIDEEYGSVAIRNMGLAQVAKDIRELYEKAKQGDEEARKNLRLMLLVFGPADLVGGASALITAIEEMA